MWNLKVLLTVTIVLGTNITLAQQEDTEHQFRSEAETDEDQEQQAAAALEGEQRDGGLQNTVEHEAEPEQKVEKPAAVSDNDPGAEDIEAEQEQKSEEKNKTVSTDQGDGEDSDLIAALKEGAEFKVGARIYGLWMMTDEPLIPTHEFRVSMARIKFSWIQWKIIEAVLKLDADQLIEDADDAAVLRDLYVRVQPLTWLGAQLGQFKRPFSRVELKSRRRLPVINRGAVNDYIVEHLMYGDRDIGMMLTGRLWEKIKLDYALGLFNGMGMNARELGLSGFKDIAGRLNMKPAKWLSLGISGSLKFIEESDLERFIRFDSFNDLDPDEYPDYVNLDSREATLSAFEAEHTWMTGLSWMTGMDLRLKFGKFSVVADGMLGENWWFKKYPFVYGVSLLLSYKHRLKKGWPLWVEPALMGEVLTLLTDWDQWRNRMWQINPGVNLHVGKYVRVMIGGEFTFTQGSESDIDGARYENLWPNEWPGDWFNSKRLLVQLAFSI
ncbi:MAG: hypothetical protein GY854_14070 [Deltaproteobacteria bacterium]|nr:hypothetical protein [Deltaproteobacteria bacterium]